jgi:hypothetical protein
MARHGDETTGQVKMTSRTRRFLSACLLAGAMHRAAPLDAQIAGDAWMAGGAVFRAQPSSVDEVAPWVEWRGTARHERFALNGTLSFADKAYVRDVVLADATPVTRSTGVATDLAIGLHLRADLQILGRGTVVSGAASAPLLPETAGTIYGLFARGEVGISFMPESQEFSDYRLGLGFLVANRSHGGSIALWAGESGRLDGRFDVSPPTRGGVTLEYLSPAVLWPRLFVRVDGSSPFHDRADVKDTPGVAGDLVDELEIMIGVVVPLIPRG